MKIISRLVLFAFLSTSGYSLVVKRKTGAAVIFWLEEMG